jgi:MFS family permease
VDPPTVIIASMPTLQPLRLPNFAYFWSAQALSKLGDPITLIALATVSYEATRSALATALAVLVSILPGAIFGFAAGAVTDAIGHRRAMVICDIARAALVGTIPLLLMLGGPLWMAFVLVFCAGIFTAVFTPARIAIVPLLVRQGELSSGNSLVFATDRTVEIIGALIAGLLVATLHAGAFYVDALTFVVSAVLLSRIRLDDPPATRISWNSIWRDAADGLHFIGERVELRANTIFSLVAQLSMPIYNGLLPVLIFRRFANGDSELGAYQFGVAEGTFAFGAVMAALVLPRYMARVRKGRLIVFGFGAWGLALILAGNAPTFQILVPIVVLAGMLNVVFFVPNVTFAQEFTPPEKRGRVFGARSALLSLSWLPIVLAAGTLAETIDAGSLIALGGALTLAVALIGTRLRVIRDIT